MVNDRENSLTESNKVNNTKTLAILSQPDLVISSVNAPNKAAWNPTVPLSWTVSNTGAGNAVGSWYDHVYLSDDNKLDASDTLVSSTLRTNTTPLAAGGSYTVSQTLTLPTNAVTKNYWLVVTDRENGQLESNELNNITAINIEGQPDLVVSAATVPADATWGATIPSQLDSE